MMRRRPVDAPKDKASNGHERKRRARQNRSSSSARSAQRICLVLGTTGALLVLLTYLYSHYNESRSRDPFTGLKLKPFAQIRDKILQTKPMTNGITPTKNENKNNGSTNRQQQHHLAKGRHSFLTVQEDKALERDADGIRYHLIFSTDCSPFQHWQSYLVYFTAMKVRQPGHVTRIASGCDANEAQKMQDWFDTDVAPLSDRFHLQLTPHFSQVKNERGEIVGDYKFFNKPFGLKYWLEYSPQIQYDATTGEFPANVVEDIVILIDPDMGLLRPLTRDFSNDREVVIGAGRKKHVLSRTVGPGQPFAQTYGFGVQWSRLDLEKIAGPGTPAAKVTNEDGLRYYPVGPPYMGTVTDMHRISEKWTEFVPKVYEQYP